MISDPVEPYLPGMEPGGPSLDPSLNATGRVNLGDVEALKENQPQLFLPKGPGSEPPKKSADEVAKLVEDMKKGVSWHLDEEATEIKGREMYFPRLFIPGLSEKFGETRPHQEFYPQERNMFVMAFLNDCSSYLFGVEAFHEVPTDNGTDFVPNEEFVKLPVRVPTNAK